MSFFINIDRNAHIPVIFFKVATSDIFKDQILMLSADARLTLSRKKYLVNKLTDLGSEVFKILKT